LGCTGRLLFNPCILRIIIGEQSLRGPEKRLAVVYLQSVQEPNLEMVLIVGILEIIVPNPLRSHIHHTGTALRETTNLLLKK
jgi:hypothetical protein